MSSLTLPTPSIPQNGIIDTSLSSGEMYRHHCEKLVAEFNDGDMLLLRGVALFTNSYFVILVDLFGFTLQAAFKNFETTTLTCYFDKNLISCTFMSFLSTFSIDESYLTGVEYPGYSIMIVVQRGSLLRFCRILNYQMAHFTPHSLLPIKTSATLFGMEHPFPFLFGRSAQVSMKCSSPLLFCSVYLDFRRVNFTLTFQDIYGRSFR